jgi:hypothetical protein
LVEERYCLNIESAKYELEGTMSRNEIKEAMIHHHPQGHPWKHLQFKMSSRSEDTTGDVAIDSRHPSGLKYRVMEEIIHRLVLVGTVIVIALNFPEAIAWHRLKSGRSSSVSSVEESRSSSPPRRPRVR